ncbi:MAG: site-specific DNA-methyltransferase [Anaerolineae bacterium]|nr:MAG: site-specific DNA-methyltransferase [Anaerolineae bacterium]
MSGRSISRNGGSSGSNANPMSWSEANHDRPRVAPDDCGDASRFFPQFESPFCYQAKPSSSERDAGLRNFRVLTGAEATDSEEGQARLNSPRTGAGRNGGRRNHHATVKSVDLMRWLIRLVTPPGGVCIDPFAGSGSGGIAALLEGMRWIGFEMNDTDEEPSVSVARARISWVEGREVIPREPLRAKEPPKQRGLFEEVGT